MFLLLHPPHRLEWKAFIEEADAGEGSRFPKRAAWGIPNSFYHCLYKRLHRHIGTLTGIL